MTRAGRGGLLTTLLVMAGLAVGACAPPGPAAGTEAPARLRPAQGETYLALGGRLLAGNEPALAMRAFNASLTMEGISVQALTGAGIAAQRQGILATAREYLEHAQKLAPESAIAQSNLGVVLLALKDYHGARTAFRSAMMLTEDPDDETLRRYLERAEMAIAARNRFTQQDPAATQRVVRLGSDSFRLTERTDGEGGSAALAALTGADAPGRAAADDEAAKGAASPAGAGAAAGTAPALEAGTGRRAESGMPAGTREAPSQGPAEVDAAVLAASGMDYGAE